MRFISLCLFLPQCAGSLPGFAKILNQRSREHVQRFITHAPPKCENERGQTILANIRTCLAHYGRK